MLRFDIQKNTHKAMERTKTIIKRHEVGHRVTKVETGPPAEELAVRIPGWKVQPTREAPPVDELVSSTMVGVVLRSAQARLAVPYMMDDLDIEPDFPLPELEPLVDETPEPLAEPEPLPEPDLRYDELEAEWQARLEEAVEGARAEAYKEGYEQGYVAAEAALQASFDQRKAMLEEDVARLQAAWKETMKKSEPLLASLAFEMVKQLLDAPLPQDVRAVSGKVLAQALEQFGEDTPIEISLHPDDLTRLQAYGLTDDLQAMHSGIRWVPNPDISMGDWIAQSPDAAIRRIKDDMLNQLKSRLGLLAVMKSRDS